MKQDTIMMQDVLILLQAVPEDDLDCWVLMVIGETFRDSTVNLKSPVIINHKTNLAVQVILDQDYPIRQADVYKRQCWNCTGGLTDPSAISSIITRRQRCLRSLNWNAWALIPGWWAIPQESMDAQPYKRGASWRKRPDIRLIQGEWQIETDIHGAGDS